MKKLTALILALVMGLALMGCGDKKAEPQAQETEVDSVQESAADREEIGFSFEGAMFTYKGEEYDLSEHGITDILSVAPVGSSLMIEGQLGPDSARYLLYDTTTGVFQEELMGNNMIWQDGDLDSAVYAFENGIYRLDGTLVTNLELRENEFVYDLEFTPDNSAVTVTVIDLEGGTRSMDVAL